MKTGNDSSMDFILPATRSISITHNIEIAHRLSQLPGKCQNIHGHGMLVTVLIDGPVSDRGLIFDMDLADIKGPIKEFLNTIWDHRLHLYVGDPLRDVLEDELPQDNVQVWSQDPTTENIAKWIGQRVHTFLCVELGLGSVGRIHVHVQETPHNGAAWTWPQVD